MNLVEEMGKNPVKENEIKSKNIITMSTNQTNEILKLGKRRMTIL